MDFIEQIFGVSPDGGDGTTEILYIAVAITIVAVLVLSRWLRRRSINARR